MNENAYRQLALYREIGRKVSGQICQGKIPAGYWLKFFSEISARDVLALYNFAVMNDEKIPATILNFGMTVHSDLEPGPCDAIVRPLGESFYPRTSDLN